MAAILAAFHVRAGVQLADRPLPEVSAYDSCELAATFIPINRNHRPRDIVGTYLAETLWALAPDFLD
ncbi:hypothetical protein ACC703_39450 [Rhizobium ruizarguesonis]